MLKNKIQFILIFLFCFQILQAQNPQKLNSAEIYNQIQKLNFLGSVLYIAAHPDDENTRLISYLSNDIKARTGYLSLTRGDGGQNLIGPQLRELLGVIRTQELIEAREKLMEEKQFFFKGPMILDTQKTLRKPCKSGIKKKYYPMWFGPLESFNLISL